MKTQLLFAALMVCFGQFEAKAQDHTFSYDASGNRTLREISFNKTSQAGHGDSVEVHQQLLDEGELNIYPNPTEGVLRIAVTGDVSLTEIKIYTMEGKEMAKWNPEPGGFESDISAYPSGSYLLWINTDKGIYRWKVVKR